MKCFLWLRMRYWLWPAVLASVVLSGLVWYDIHVGSQVIYTKQKLRT
jgi:hypothetical protein